VSKKILLVEDHPELRRLMADALRRTGYELLEAADGNTGIRLALRETPDLVLLNLSLPGRSGLEVAKQLKENSKTSHIPIVACSGWQDEHMIRQSREAGVAEYLTKPCSGRTIQAVIKKHIGIGH
jgi:DNA-binding response OmpR family regulator